MKYLFLFFIVLLNLSAGAQTFSLEDLIKIHRSSYDSVKTVLETKNWKYLKGCESGINNCFQWNNIQPSFREVLRINYARDIKQTFFFISDLTMYTKHVDFLKNIQPRYIVSDHPEVYTITFQQIGNMQVKATLPKKEKPLTYILSFETPYTK